ncbi:MAG: DEAD/DEAH box helicase [Pseudomonadota bacterium]
MSNFNDLNLSSQILTALEKKGYTTPTPIQIQSIPHLLEGKDLLGIAQTGTGKTAAFALPILDNLFKSGKSVQHSNVRALILTPTRELASQIVDNIKLYGEDLHLKSAVIFGGVNMNNQIRASKQGFDILVATPGRLLDLVNQGHLKFSQLEIFVLDEADRMLDMGFINDVKKIIAKLPKERQTLFFSATMPKDVAVLAASILNNPVRVEVTPESTTVEKIDQRVNLVEKANKPLLLKSIIDNEGDDNLFLVFSKTKHNANRIVEFLEKQNVKVSAIHGNKSQSAREKALDGFRQGKIKVLVATDIAARGIDVAGITHVINYDIPNHPESYVHRIGRTARAGREGIAISFCDHTETGLLKDIEKVIKMKLPVDETHPFHGVKATAAAKSALPAKERPKSGYRSTPKPAFAGERKPSYFAETRRWKDGERPSKPKFSDDKKPRFNEERKPRADFRENSERKFNNDRPARDGENRTPRPRFGGDDSRAKPRFNDDRRPSFSSENRAPRFGMNENSERPRRDFSDRKPSGFGGARTSDRPAFRDNAERKFDDKRPSRFSGEASARPKFSDDRRTNSYDSKDRRSKFTSDDKFPKRDFGDRKPSGFGGGFGGDRAKPRFDDRGAKPKFGENKSRSFDSKPRGEGAGQPRGEGRIGRAFSKDRNNSGGKFSGGFGGGRKPTKPTNR